MNHPTRTLAALTGAAALTVTGLSPASAALFTHDDATGDVESYSWDERTGEESGPDPEPENTDTDITRLSADHKARRLVLSATLRDITVDSGVIVHQIRTGRRTYHAVQRLGTDREMGPAFALYRGDGHRVRCPGAGRSVDRTTELAVVDIPRRCVERPRWVRVGAVAYKAMETRTTYSYRVDEALRDGATDLGTFALSPRIRRG